MGVEYSIVSDSTSEQPGTVFFVDIKGDMQFSLSINCTPLPADAVLSKTADNADILAKEFYKLVEQWKKETFAFSSLGDIFTNDAYQRIMAMGDKALPLILSELEKKPEHWFYALDKIVGYDVAADAKNFAEARAIWLEWGRNNKYI